MGGGEQLARRTARGGQSCTTTPTCSTAVRTRTTLQNTLGCQILTDWT